jgi:alpha-tubulin suppressor-like RCC1 family protein
LTAQDHFAGKAIKQLVSWHHTVAVLESGELWVWGNNAKWQLGLSDTDHRKAPIGLLLIQSQKEQPKVLHAAAGSAHSAAVIEGGNLYTWGENLYGELGTGDTHPIAWPQRLKTLSEVKVARVFAGEYHTIALLTTGELFSWGLNSGGQLGLGDTASKSSPTLIQSFPPQGTHVTLVACGSQHTTALLDNGSVYTWGLGRHGELGHGQQASAQLVPKLVEFFDASKPRIVGIAAGAHHSAAWSQEGQLFVWGLNSAGQLGLGNTMDQNVPCLVEGFGPVARVACGGNFTLALSAKGELSACGDNSAGQLSQGTTKAHHTFVPIKCPGTPVSIQAGLRNSFVGLAAK